MSVIDDDTRARIIAALEGLRRDADEDLAAELEAMSLDALEARLRVRPLPDNALRALAVARRRVRN